MTLFDSFGKPSWQHRDPEVRRAAVDEIEDESVLVSLIKDDPDEEVRSLALVRITNGDVLEDLVQILPSPFLEQAKKQLLGVLLPDPGKLSSMTDEARLVRIAGLTDEPELLDACIGRLRKPETLVDLAINHPLAKVRIAAAQEIEEEQYLKELLAQSRHKDKSVYRLSKERLDILHEAARIESERRAQIAQLLEDAGKLSSAVDSPEYKARFQVLEHRWIPLKEHATAEQRQKIEGDLETCARRIDDIERLRRAETEQHVRVEEAGQTFKDVLVELQGINPADLDLASSDGVKAFTTVLDGFENRWLGAMHDARPSSEQTRECKERLSTWRKIAQISQRISDRKPAMDQLHEEAGGLAKSDYMAHHKLLRKVEKHLKKLAWPETHSAFTPEPILGLNGLKEQLQHKLADLKKQEKNKLQQLDKAFTALVKELDDSHFNNADRLHNKIRNLLKQLGPDHQDRFHEELRPLTARLHEIHDWQGFAIEPKKVELCERMSALVGSDEPPDALAVKIKALQDEWKNLGHISPRRDQALWKKFHAAAEEAYKPCKEAFKRQSELKKENFKQRMALVEQLIDYDNRMNWPGSPESDSGAPGPDWRMVQKTLDTARSAFNSIKPLDGRGERKSRKALKKACDRIYGHIKDEYGRNISRKEELVREAQSLAEIEDLREAINRAKDIQRDWKSVGLTPRQVDRKLWKELRKACDAVFARLDDQRKAERAVKNERIEQAKLRAKQERERWPRLLDRMHACALKISDEEKAAALWNREGGIPRDIDKNALEAWWENGSDQEASEVELRQACIAMEILLEVDSPPEDKDARMEYQMQRLLEGLGSAQAEHHERLIQQINDFIAMRPPAKWLERFVCDGKIIPRSERERD